MGKPQLYRTKTIKSTEKKSTQLITFTNMIAYSKFGNDPSTRSQRPTGKLLVN